MQPGTAVLSAYTSGRAYRASSALSFAKDPGVAMQRLGVCFWLLLLMGCEDAAASAMSMSRPLPEMDGWFFVSKYLRPEWFQWTLTILIFLIFLILSQLSCFRPADLNRFDKTMKPGVAVNAGPPKTGRAGAPGRNLPKKAKAEKRAQRT